MWGDKMRLRKEVNQIENKRLLSISDVCLYVGLGKNTARVYMDEIGATRKIGSRVLFDKVIIDKALDNMNV